MAVVAVVLVGTAAGGMIVWWEARHEERDRREILSHLERMERAIRQHDPWLWLHVEEHDAPPGPDTAQEAEHQKMLVDFERLSHIEGFKLKDTRVEVVGNSAVVYYQIEGTIPSGRGRPPNRVRETTPAGGELHFERGPRGWQMTRHVLQEPALK